MPIVPTKDRPLNMPCDDPEGCKHFKAEIKLQEQIKELVADKENLRQYASGLENAQNLITVRYRELETLLEQLIPIAEKADTDDSEDTTIELAKQALSRS